MYVAGEWVEPAKGGYAVVNPATEDVIGEAPEAGVDQVNDAVAAARGAFPAWARQSPAERGALPPRLARPSGKGRVNRGPTAARSCTAWRTRSNDPPRVGAPGAGRDRRDDA